MIRTAGTPYGERSHESAVTAGKESHEEMAY